MLSQGDKAPSFELVSSDDTTIGLAGFKGKTVVLYFYPKDDTSGCTKQAQGFTEKAAQFEAAGAGILGVSPDSVKKHRKFIEKYDLGISLLADEEKTVCEAYGVWVEKSMYGRKYMGVERSTFIIDGKGKIAQVWRKVKVPGHVEDVLDAVKAMS